MKARIGRHRPRHVYIQTGTTSHDDDPEIATCTSAAVAELLVELLNASPVPQGLSALAVEGMRAEDHDRG